QGATFHVQGNTSQVTPAGTTASTLAVMSATGNYGGTTTLTATLTTGGRQPLDHQTVTLSVNGNVGGSSPTNSDGGATLQNVSLAGFNAGTYTGLVGAHFYGDATYAASSAAADLTVNAVGTTASTLTVASAAGTYGSTTTLTATLTAGGQGLVNQ